MSRLVNPYRFGLPSISSRRWRVRIIGAPDIWLDIAAIEMAATIGGADQCTGGPIIANNGLFTNSSNMIDGNNSTYGEYHAFNNLLNSGPTIDFLSAKVVKEVRIRVANTFVTRGPSAIVVDTFDGVSTYTPVFWGINTTPYTANSLKTFTLRVIPMTQATTPFWSLNVTETNNAGFNGIAAFNLRASSGGANLSEGAAPWASASNGDSSGYGPPPYAFDANASTFYYCSTGVAGVYKSRLMATHAVAPNPTHFMLQARPSFTADTPKDFTLDYSLDGCLTWTTAKTITGATGWGNSESREYAL